MYFLWPTLHVRGTNLAEKDHYTCKSFSCVGELVKYVSVQLHYHTFQTKMYPFQIQIYLQIGAGSDGKQEGLARDTLLVLAWIR